MTQKKVLHIIGSLSFSGAEKMLLTSFEYLKSKGIDSHILVISSRKGEYAKELERIGFKIHFIKSDLYRNQKSPKKLFYHFISFFKFIKKNNFDTIHFHFEWANFWHISIARLATNKNLVRTIHNVFQFEGWTKYERLIQRYILRKFINTRFITIGPSVYKHEKNVYKNPSTLIPNWVDEKVFAPLIDPSKKLTLRQQLNLPTDKPILISVGACQLVKNHKAILMALAKIKNKGFIYIHLGNGELEKEEKNLAKELQIDHLSLFKGNVTNVRDYLVASDIYIMPSKFEGLSISLLEAMSCGLPAIVYNSYGLIDLVEHNYNGLIAQNNIDHLAINIEKLLTNKPLREKMSKNALKFVHKHYNMKNSLEKLSRMY